MPLLPQARGQKLTDAEPSLELRVAPGVALFDGAGSLQEARLGSSGPTPPMRSGRLTMRSDQLNRCGQIMIYAPDLCVANAIGFQHFDLEKWPQTVGALGSRQAMILIFETLALKCCAWTL